VIEREAIDDDDEHAARESWRSCIGNRGLGACERGRYLFQIEHERSACLRRLDSTDQSDDEQPERGGDHLSRRCRGYRRHSRV
jgi:hypothetical protein